jgi:hypothetical protein
MSEWNAEATTNLLKLVARHGAPGRREIAQDVLAGRHSLRDLAYLPAEPGDGMNQLLDRWDRTSEQERAALAADSEQAMSRIIDNIAATEIDEPPPSPKPRPPKATEDDDSYYTENQWFPEPED